MKTTQELLMMQQKDELIAQTIRLGLPPLREAAEPEAWAQHIADGLTTHWENLLLMLTQEEVRQLQAALSQGTQVRPTETEDGGTLLSGLMTLAQYGLAEEAGDLWEVDARVAGWLTLDEAEMAQQHMQDLLYDYMQGWLIHLGIAPMEELTARAAALPEPETPQDREDLQRLCHAMLMARDGLNGMILDEYEEPWAVQADLEDPEALLERLRMPFLRELPWPDFGEDALILSAQQSRLAGSVKLYIPLLEFLEAQGLEEADELVCDAAAMIQNEHVDEAVDMLTEACGLTSLRLMEQLAELVFGLCNAMPRWYNKGYSPDELAARKPARGNRAPSRNDPCPCGSGRKYKVCCGRRQH